MQKHSSLRFLSPEDESLIYEKCIDLLSRKGVKIDYPKGLEVLAKAGVEANRETGFIRFSRSQIEEALKTAPKTFTVKGSDEKSDFVVPHPEGSFYTSTCVQSMLYHDPDTDSFASVTCESLAEWTRLADSLENIHKIAMQTPTDAPSASADVHSLNIHLQNTTKPLMILAYCPESVEYMFDLMLARAGSPEALAKRPMLLTYPTSFSPLRFKPMDLETIFYSCRYGIPVVANSLAISGGTAPVTVAGTVLLAAVEIIAMVVMCQLLRPGIPVIASIYTTSMDMATGNALLGNAESMLARAAASQFIKSKFGIPVETFSFMTDAYVSDGQALMEKSLTPALLDLAGSDIQYGAGRLGGSTLASPVQLIIDNELYTIIKRCNGPLKIDEETLAFQELMDMEPGGNFLTSEHTLRHCRENIRPGLFVADSFDIWKEKGSKNLYERAVDKYRSLKKTLQAPILSQEILRDMNKVVANADKHLKKK
jgi:trimethylamine---corrinoid protein Co-methyltransferase